MIMLTYTTPLINFITAVLFLIATLTDIVDGYIAASRQSLVRTGLTRGVFPGLKKGWKELRPRAREMSALHNYSKFNRKGAKTQRSI